MKMEGRVFVSPLARKIAVDKNVDLSQVQGNLVIIERFIYYFLNFVLFIVNLSAGLSRVVVSV